MRILFIKSLLASLFQREVEATLRGDSLRELCPSLAKRSEGRFCQFFSLLIISHLLLVSVCYAELIDRVVAFVDDRAITLTEFMGTYEKAKSGRPDISKGEVLNTYINRILLLREAKKLRLEAKTDDELINSYIELKVKAFIRLRDEDMKEFYNTHLSEFEGAEFDSVRARIEEYLTEKEVNNLLKRHIDELRSKAY